MATQIQLRRDTAANWTSTNPTMAQGEAGYETDTGKLKIGDGSTAWNSLAYQAAANIVDGTIVNADVNASAAIAGTKISPDFGSQNVVTTGTATAASLNPTGSSVPTNGVYLPAANTVGVATNSTGRLFINSSGQVGLGTSSPSELLTVGGASVNIGLFNSTAGTTGSPSYSTINFYGFGQNANGNIASISAGNSQTNDFGGILRFSTNTTGGTHTERMRIDSSGRLGIGTTSPNSVLQVNSGTNLGGILIGFNAGSSNFYDADLQVFRTGNGTERARIDSSGRLLVGTTSSTGVNSNFAPVIAGNFVSFTGSVSAPTGTATTLFALENLNASYIVTAIITGTADAANYSAVYMVATVVTDSRVIQAIRAGGLLTLSLSGGNVQATQSSGNTQTITWSVTRMANL